MRVFLIFIFTLLFSSCAKSQKVDSETHALLDTLYKKQIISKIQYDNSLADTKLTVNTIFQIFPNSFSIKINELSSKTNEETYRIIAEKIAKSFFPNDNIQFIKLLENEKKNPLLLYTFNQNEYRTEDWNNINESISKYLSKGLDNSNPILYSTYVCFNYFLMDNNSNERIIDICVNKGEETTFYFIKIDSKKHISLFNQKEIIDKFHRHRFNSEIIWENKFSKDSLRIIVNEFDKMGLLSTKMNDKDFEIFINRLRDYPHRYLNVFNIIEALGNFSNFKSIDIFDCLYKESKTSQIDNYLNIIHSISQFEGLEENIKEAINKPDNQKSNLKISFKIKNKKYIYAKQLEPITHNDYPQNCIPSNEIITFFNNALRENMVEKSFIALTPYDPDDEPQTVIFITQRQKDLITKLFPYGFVNSN